MHDDALMYCLVVLVIDGIVLYVYHYVCNPNNDVERYYLKNSKCQFYLLKFVYLVVLVSAIICGRYMLSQAPSIFAARLRRS